jgi:hypothetical protein
MGAIAAIAALARFSNGGLIVTASRLAVLDQAQNATASNIDDFIDLSLNC